MGKKSFCYQIKAKEEIFKALLAAWDKKESEGVTRKNEEKPKTIPQDSEKSPKKKGGCFILFEVFACKSKTKSEKEEKYRS